MKVYVIMGNDYPDAVFKEKEDAEAYIKKKNEEEVKSRTNHLGPKIYWKHYEFELR